MWARRFSRACRVYLCCAHATAALRAAQRRTAQSHVNGSARGERRTAAVRRRVGGAECYICGRRECGKGRSGRDADAAQLPLAARRYSCARERCLVGGGGVIARVQGSDAQLTPAFVPPRCRRRKTTALPEKAHGNAMTTVILP